MEELNWSGTGGSICVTPDCTARFATRGYMRDSRLKTKQLHTSHTVGSVHCTAEGHLVYLLNGWMPTVYMYAVYVQYMYMQYIYYSIATVGFDSFPLIIYTVYIVYAVYLLQYSYCRIRQFSINYIYSIYILYMQYIYYSIAAVGFNSFPLIIQYIQYICICNISTTV